VVRERGTQRTDVLAAVRDLTRLELITEAVRAALEEIAGAAPRLLVGLVDEEWGRRYGRPVRLGRVILVVSSPIRLGPVPQAGQVEPRRGVQPRAGDVVTVAGQRACPVA
jgi:hypothetical protein